MEMEVFVQFVVLVHVSQHASAVVIQAYEGEQAIVLPYRFFDHHFAVPDDPIVSWNRSRSGADVIIHRRTDDGDLKNQDEHYRGRTSMATEALDSGDFSLTLAKPQMSDSGNYTCTIWTGKAWLRLTEIQLQVKDDQVVVEVQEEAESVRLPCKTSPDLPNDTRVEWTYLDPVDDLFQVVSVYQNSDRGTHTAWGHTHLDKDLLITGDLSLTMKRPTEEDAGTYICIFYVKGDTMKQRVDLQVISYVVIWFVGTVLFLNSSILVLAVLCRPKMTSVDDEKMEVESGVESVQLSCGAPLNVIASTVSVEWTNKNNDTLYTYKRDANVASQQADRRDRPRIYVNPDFSLTLKYPTDHDNSTYTCTLYKRNHQTLLTKRVELEVKVCEVEVEEGAESALLPFRTTQNLPEDATVTWFHYSDDIRKRIYIYTKDSVEQDQMDENPLGSGDLSLILKNPTATDNGKYGCHVKLNNATLTRKTVYLSVKGTSQRVAMSSTSSSTVEDHPEAECGVSPV